MKKKGISLITLIITIVVVIILAAAVVLALSKNNPISDSRVAQITQTRDSLSSGILIYATNVQSKTLGEIGIKDILTVREDYKIIVDDRSTDKTITKDGVEIKLYKLDDEKVKEKLNIDLKNQKDRWYIDQNGLVYMVYDDIESVPSYLKENNKVIASVANCVTYNGASIITATTTTSQEITHDSEPPTPVVTTYTVTYDANGGSGEMSASTGETVTIAECTFTAPEGKEFDSWNTAQDGSGTTYNAGATISSNVTLYAKWKDILYETFEVGDEVTILNGSTAETFFVIKDSTANENKVTVITKENIDTANLVQSSSASNVRFSSTYYWWDNTNSKYYDKYMKANDIDLNVDIGSIESTENKYALYAAQEYGTKLHGTGRLILHSEASTLLDANYADLLYANNGIFKATNNCLNYWLGSADNVAVNRVWYIYGGSMGCVNYNDGNEGVRPVIEISKTLVTKVTN